LLDGVKILNGRCGIPESGGHHDTALMEHLPRVLADPVEVGPLVGVDRAGGQAGDDALDEREELRLLPEDELSPLAHGRGCLRHVRPHPPTPTFRGLSEAKKLWPW
jgi:hypothetical protein